MGKCWNNFLLLLVCACIGAQQKTLTLNFTHSLYNATIFENSIPKTFVECPIKMGIFILDRFWDISYRIESGDHKHLFKAEEHVLGDFSFLRIKTKGGRSATLNREVNDQYIFTVLAVERHSGVEARTQVKLQILDTNDHSPLFSPTIYSITVPESTAIYTSIGKVSATDADTGTNGEYYFSFKEWTSVFSVHPTSGVITLTGKLDYLDVPRYDIDVLAVDRGIKHHGSGGVSSTAKLTVQVLQANVHSPVVTAILLTPWNTTQDPSYAFLTVEDDDEGENGEIASLDIVAGDPFQQFKAIRVSPQMKEYKIKAIKEVAWEGYNFGYNLTLHAKDKGNPPRFSSAVTVKVKPPHDILESLKFEKSIYRVTISEFAPPHSPVVTVRAMTRYVNMKYLIQYRIKQHNYPFTINPNTGLVTTVEPLQAEHVSQYEFNVITSDRRAETKIVVNVKDMNSNAPKFEQPAYEASVDEHMPIGSSILAVHARDVDSGDNGYVTYSIVNVNKQPFAINYFTGVISPSEDLDYEVMPSKFYLRIRASDWGTPFRREAEVMVSITLINLNDNQPLFENIDCNVSVPRSLRVGEQITVVSAIDADDLGLVLYHITAGNDKGLFDLHPNSGTLTLKKSLIDRDGKQQLFSSIEITANDGEISSFPMNLTISFVSDLKEIYLNCVETGVLETFSRILFFGPKVHNERQYLAEFLDMHSVNNHSPKFIDSTPSLIEVKEDLPVGTSILFLKAADNDSGFNGKLLFVISGGNFDNCLMIDTDTGWLKINEPLDREVTDHYTLNITVYDLGLPQKASSHILEIQVLDVNDNSPEFLQNEYSVDVREDSVVGTDVIELEAIDKDLGTNGKVRYCFLTKTDTFIINEETGIVTVQSPLDREATPSFALKVAAYDKATEEPQLISSVILNIMLADVNDNVPTFSPLSYHVRVREDIPVGTLILWLEAHDPDLGQSGQVRYSLTSDADGSFYVDKVSGAVYLFQTLDFERKQVYNLTAEARDRGKPISLSSTCCIEVEIVDVNENLHRPSFPFFVACGNVTEDARPGASVTKVTAYDEDEGRDGEIRYAIHEGSGLGVFTIDEMSGVIRTQELLDHETTAHYWLIVYATDKAVVPLSSSVEVYVEVQDVNDNAPETSEPVYCSSVPENSPKDVSIIWIQAFDPDSKSSDKLTYEITGGNLQGFFTINSQTGLLTTTSQKLDREEQEEHTLEVTISDNGSPAMSTAVHVVVKVQDENDNAPQFLEKVYKIKVVERAEAIEREPIYRIIARDRDESPHSEISYTIEEGEESRRFFIEPQSGLVSSKEAFSVGEYHILTIKALDSGHPQKSSSCHLHIEWIAKPELPKEELMFEEISLQFSVMESDPVGHMVGVISTQPLDSPVWFDIKGGNGGRWYTLEKGSGTIIIAKPLDAEQRSHYNLTVEATDGTRSTSTQVLIKVIDTNEHQPQFAQAKYEINIPEETQPGTKILKISATDKDDKKKLSYKLLSSTDPHSLKNFRLDPWTGFLYTAEELDHETMHRHILTVMVRDQHVPVKRNLVRVIIHVEDRNDNAPWFTSSQYSGQVFESAAIGSAVLQVTALDKDKGQNAEILYSIESGDDSNSFEIDMILGIIKVAEELGCTNRSQYELKVKASDKGDPPLSVFTTIYITVTISNNAEPKFNPSPISVEISEAAPVGTFVTMVTASSQSSVLYQIKEGNTNGTFDINPNSGSIVTRRKLDYETLSSYKLTVQGTNMAGMSSDVMLLVFVKDVNDNAPVFTQTEFMGYISEAATLRTVVLTNEDAPLVIHATDADEKANARLVYQIVEPFARNYFAIDSGAGVIQTISSLDYEYRRVFHFTVQAHDAGVPCLFTQSVASVTVYVIDVNDCNPRFSQDFFEATLLLPTYKGVRVITLNATDDDSLPNAKLLFSILDGNTRNNFKIDPILGEIFVQNATQLHSRYILTVRVSDGKFTSTAMAKITVQENKAHGLKFTQEIFTASIQENSSERETLAIIAAVGNKIDEPLLYSILNPDRRFDIGHTSGVLFTTGIPFDREEQDTFDVIVEVTKEKNGVGTAHVLVKVTVEDVNDNAPLFVNLPYTIVAQMDAIVGTVFRQVTAVDRDVDRNSEIKYHLKGGDKYFQINPSGEVSLKRLFEQESLNTRFLLKVIAVDGGHELLSSTAEMTITVVNKATPVFERPFYKIEIPENVLLHTSVVQVLANESVGTRTVYKIYEGDLFGHFSINFNTGVIEVIKPLDYETHPAHRIIIHAVDSLTGAHAEVFVDIILEDINDNAPMFDMKSYNISISESVMIGASVLQITARDSDSGINKEIFYHLYAKNGSNSEHFRIDDQSGVIWTTAMLDHETEPKHELTIKALDCGVPQLYSMVTVVIHVTDLNDNPPVFSHQLYNATVSELSPPGHFVARVYASDADSTDIAKLEFFFLSGNEDSVFGIDKSSGVIAIASHQRQKLESIYNLIVFATDGVFRALAKVKVDVISANKYSPLFTQDKYVVELLENSPLGTLVAWVQVHDQDPGEYGEVTLFIVNDVAQDKFTVNADGQIHTAESFDRENAAEKVIPINILAKDGGGKVGFCTVVVLLSDVNDNAPKFRLSEYKATVWDTVPIGMTVIKISAVDDDEGSNADIVYTMDSDIGHFEIHPFSGAVVTKGSLMELQNAMFSFYVKAKDSGSPSKQSVVPVSITILPSDLPVPMLAETLLQLELAEDLPVGTELYVIQSKSKDPMLYRLIRGNIPESNRDDAFVIETNTGKLKLTKRLDYETTKWYQLSVQVQGTAEHMELTSVIDINIQLKDVNDNNPQFDSCTYKSFIVENLPGGTSVVQVRAMDLDSGVNGQVVYSLAENQENPEILELFAVDSRTGWVTTVSEIDREKKDMYTIIVIATDRAPELQMTGTTIVEVAVVDVNDNPPVFTEAVYKAAVREDESAPGTVITTLSITDNDSEEINRRFSCFITSKEPQGLFLVGYVYSACTVMAGKTLDREDREHYVLNITATDGTYMAKTTVDLTVLDANDNDPVCEKGLYAVKVPENSPAGKLILRVSATDPDIKSNAEIIYRLTGGGDDSFRIDSATGTLETLLPLDREKRDVYNVTVQALDGENRFCQADVLITVEDINDNAPIFTSDMYHVNVLENTQPGACLARLQASDADTGLNSKISYSFEYSAGGLFSIEEQSGIISLVKPLNRPKKASYRLRVCAVDHGAPRRLSSLCSVEVAVVGANNHPPLFEQRDYVSTVPEDIAVGTQLLTVFAAGRDVQSNGHTWYSITAGNEKGAFRINSQTGDIFVIARLDYEASRQHYLTVKATSGGEEALSDTATVTIHLTDVNDNCPVFSQEVYSAAVQEDSEAGCSVLTVITHMISYGSPFIIDTVSGVVKVAHQLDREKVAGYKLTVLASDSGNPPKSSTAAINITVADVNDNSPIFSQVNYSLVIQESLHSGASVLQLSVTDNDSPENGPPFSYNIFKGNEGKLFSIDHQGVVRTTASLKSIGKNEYAVYVQVSDSGQPPLQSSALLNIHIAQASVYPPCVFPQEIFILVLGEEFPGGFIGKVHATDPDEYDTLTYSFEPPLNNLFSVSGADGHLLAYGGLDVGYYLLNISVSDGRFSASAGVTVHVRRITQRMLDRSVSVRFAGINATHFIHDHWRNIQRVLCGIAGTRVAGVQILSLQPVEANDLDVLMSLEGSGSSHSFLELLLHKLNTSSTVPARLSSLRVVSVTPRWCTDTERLGRVCGRVVTLDPSSMVVSGTSRVSYVTPHYRITPRCICKGEKCPERRQGCSNNICPEGYYCMSFQGKDKYHCICQEGKEEKCYVIQSSLMRFSEKSYIKYHWRRNTTEVIKFSLRFKTLSSHGTVMIVKGRGYSILEVAEGRLQCHLDCGSGLATMPVHRTAVNDGHWHTVEMEVKRSHARLVLDHLHSASSILSGAYPCLGLDVQVILGRHTGLLGSRPRRTLSVSSSLQGCMDLVRLNEHSLLLRSEALSGIALDDMAEVMPGCDMNSTPDTDCSSNPCLNGGHCSQRRSGGYYCMCNNLFMGVHCEFSMSPCASNPCLYGGVCIQNNNEYYCRCRGQYTGQRCEIGPYCKENPCMNGGHCIDSLDGPVCECKAGFKGERCLADMDECLQLPCLNGGWCTNTHGSFNCSCQPGFSGRLCEMHGDGHDIFISSSWNVDLAEPAVILFLAIFFLAVLNILVCHTYCKSSKEEQEREIHRAAEAYTQRAYLDNRPGRKTFLGTPPPVPLKPVSYTPSASGDPSKAMDSGSMPEFSSLTPDVRLGPRKMVAVCSGSPSLPQCRDSCLPTDSESVQKSDMDEDDNGRTVLVQARSEKLLFKPR
uniref:FAT atypical cadherin 1a n=1 Tax=Electrophorus electricus TaxID=8005 RepID=A0A4W4GWN5_ELEEL